MEQTLAHVRTHTHTPTTNTNTLNTHTHTHTHTVWFQQSTSFPYGKKSRQTKDAEYLLRRTGAFSRKLFAVQKQ